MPDAPVRTSSTCWSGPPGTGIYAQPLGAGGRDTGMAGCVVMTVGAVHLPHRGSGSDIATLRDMVIVDSDVNRIMLFSKS